MHSVSCALSVDSTTLQTHLAESEAKEKIRHLTVSSPHHNLDMSFSRSVPGFSRSRFALALRKTAPRRTDPARSDGTLFLNLASKQEPVEMLPGLLEVLRRAMPSAPSLGRPSLHSGSLAMRNMDKAENDVLARMCAPVMSSEPL